MKEAKYALAGWNNGDMKRPSWLARFTFSPAITSFCFVLAAAMFWASSWQWQRYHEKTALIDTYSADAEVQPLAFPIRQVAKNSYSDIVDRRVRVRGQYDFKHQVIVTNRKGAAGPGHWLLTPLKIEGSELTVIVSRGFIPFEDRTPETWTKYDFAEMEEFDAVVKPSAEQLFLGPRNPEVGGNQAFQTIFFFPEVSKFAKQLPYPLIPDIFLQRIGPPPVGEFPAQSILVEVPPSTHFGYTFEWILLGLATLVLGFLAQAFPRRKRPVSSVIFPEDSSNAQANQIPH